MPGVPTVMVAVSSAGHGDGRRRLLLRPSSRNQKYDERESLQVVTLHDASIASPGTGGNPERRM